MFVLWKEPLKCFVFKFFPVGFLKKLFSTWLPGNCQQELGTNSGYINKQILKTTKKGKHET